jgi:hypothetical protein
MDIRPITLCLLGSDTDCDGTAYFAHRVKVPRAIAHDLDAILAFVRTFGDGYNPADSCCSIDRWSVYEIITSDEFNARFADSLDTFSKVYFRRAGYTTLGASWQPWAYDDSIGIPAYWPAD